MRGLRYWVGIGVLTLAPLLVSPVQASDVKIGFVVKGPQFSWFQDEWKFAQQAADKFGFTLVKIGAEDGEKALAALNNLGAQGAGGVVICVPNVKLGPAIVAAADANQLKLMTVDDRLVDANGKAIESVVHMGISATKIGETVGEAIVEQAKARGWNLAEVGAISLSYDQLPTAADRIGGAISVLTAAGLPKDNIFNAPMPKDDTESAVNVATTVLNQKANINKWILISFADEYVIGGVRATEAAGLPAEDVIGVGIGGAESAVDEFSKPQPTGFVGSVVISPKRHGYETSENMYNWITKGEKPPLLTWTAGVIATRDTYKQVRADLGL